MIATSLDGLAELVGRDIGASDWVELDQPRVDAFADLTRDHQWIHVDPERAVREGLGGTIVHGFFTLALIPSFIAERLEVLAISRAINYGLEKVRFPASVMVGSRVRGHVRIDEVGPCAGGLHVRFVTTVEAEGVEKPVCVAESVARFYA